MAYLIDSDLVIDYLAGSEREFRLIELLMGDGVAVSTISCVEVFEGVERSDEPKLAGAVVDDLLNRVEVLMVTVEVARTCASIRLALRSQGKRIRPRAMDLLIGATAVAHGLTLVSRNRDDYADIPGLRLYDF